MSTRCPRRWRRSLRTCKTGGSPGWRRPPTRRAEDHARAPEGEIDQHHRQVQVHLERVPARPSTASSTRASSRSAESPKTYKKLKRRQARLQGAGDRQGGQRRQSGQAQVHGAGKQLAENSVVFDLTAPAGETAGARLCPTPHVKTASARKRDRSSPVRWIPADEERGKPESGLGLCLSGRRYRAMLFHPGALWRLNELGYLKQLDARLQRLRRLDRRSSSRSALEQSCSAPIKGRRATPTPSTWRRRWWPDPGLAAQTLDVAGRAAPACSCRARRSAPRLAAAYRQPPVPGTTPSRTCRATRRAPASSSTPPTCSPGVLRRFSRPYIADYRVGDDPRARSHLWPMRWPPRRPSRRSWRRADAVRGRPVRPRQRRRPADIPSPPSPTLADGGVYDNLGLETAWKKLPDGPGQRRRRRDGSRRGGWPSGLGWRDWATQMVRVTTRDRQPGQEPAQTADGRGVPSPCGLRRAPARDLLGDPQRHRQLQTADEHESALSRRRSSWPGCRPGWRSLDEPTQELLITPGLRDLRHGDAEMGRRNPAKTARLPLSGPPAQRPESVGSRINDWGSELANYGVN